MCTGAIWGMLYADDASMSVTLAKMMAVIVTVFEAAGLTVSEKKTETMLLLDTESGTPDLAARHRSSRPEM